MLRTIDTISLPCMLLLLTLLSVLLGLLLHELSLLAPISLLFLDRVQDVVAFYKLRIVWPNALIFELFVLL